MPSRLRPVPPRGILPPHIVERLSRCGDPDLEQLARENEQVSDACRQQRTAIATAAKAPPASGPGLERRVHDVQHRSSAGLPGKLVRGEGDPPTGDESADEAYDHSGWVYDFFQDRYGRDSLDDAGMALISSVHLGRRYANAFWNGEQMVYGDGDGKVFGRFTRALDVVAHEMSHGVITFTSNLIYQGESGALNESFADIFGVLTEQWRLDQSVDDASWLIGASVLIPAPTRRALRDLAAPGTAYRDDPYLGDDPQPAHMDDIYRGWADNGGVHINSGIPNHAFYRFAADLGGNAWERAGEVWYHSLLVLPQTATFADCAQVTERVAGERFGDGGPEQQAVHRAWEAVGVAVDVT